MIIILSLFCCLMAASTNTGSLEPTPEKGSHAWSPLPTSGLSLSDKVLASIINLAQAHFIHGHPNLSAEVGQTLHHLMVTHTTKMRLFYIINGRWTVDPQNAQHYAEEIVRATSVNTPSKLQLKTANFLQWAVIDAQPPFIGSHELAPLLKTPDTAPIQNLLEQSLLEHASIPLIKEPLETLLSLDWRQVFPSFVKSGFSQELHYTWGHCEKGILQVVSLTNADSLEQLMRAYHSTQEQLHTSLNLTSVFLAKKAMLRNARSQVSAQSFLCTD